MGVSVVFAVPCVPIAQPRQRHRAVTANGRTFVANYTPKKDPVNAFKAAIRDACKKVYNGPPLDGPIRVALTFIMPRPKGLYWKTKAMPRRWHETRPDFDNLTKAACDALSTQAWRDDAQICDVHIRKLIAAGDEAPHALIEVASLLAENVEEKDR
mgnify:CR=1 FL=1